jgi:VWFA-related protein
MLRLLFFLALCLALCLPLVPQTQQQPTQPQQAPASQAGEPTTRIRAGVSEVIVPVTVKDDKGRYVSNLEQKDFRILDEGQPQKITYFSHQQKQSIVVGFLVDLSSANRIHWKTYQDAMLELVWQLLPGDDPRYSGYLITYSNNAEVRVNTTHENDRIADAIRKAKPGGGSTLYDAIYKACTDRSLIKGEPYEPRRIIIIIGDGHDNASKKSLEEVLELAQRNLVTIYAISTQAFGFENQAEDVLHRLTTDTGGHVEYPLNDLYKDISGYLSTPKDSGNYVYEAGTGGYEAQIAGGITRAVQGLVGDIATQYILRYTPDLDPDAKPKVMHRIKVEIPSLPAGVNVYHRKFYFPEGVPLGPGTSQ